MNKTILPWIEVGYKAFAYGGPQSLKIQPLASQVGKNKSSFYHLFADLEVFTSMLLSYHLAQADLLAQKEAASKSMDEIIEVLIHHKTDLLFNRQLQIHRENQEFEKVFCKTNETTAAAIIGVWAQMLNLEDDSYLAGLVLKLSLENFYLQITDETLNRPWLETYMENLKELVKAFKQHGKFADLDGSV